MKNRIIRKKKQPKYIYVISDGTDRKIGVATDPETRLKALQTGNKNKLILEYVEQKNDAHKIEKYLHRCFWKHHIGGEWFSDITLHDIRVKLLICVDYD